MSEQLWKESDADGSGTLDRAELKAVLLRMGRAEESIDINAVVRNPRSVETDRQTEKHKYRKRERQRHRPSL